MFLSLHAAGEVSGPRICVVPYAELDSLLPRAALFVHHGGIGSTARALEAGVPQIIIPRGYDQPDNAHRAVQLGVARMLGRGAVSGPSLANAARQLLGSKECSASLQRLKKALADSPAAEVRCGDLLEAQISERRTTEPLSPATAVQQRTVVFVVWPERGHITLAPRRSAAVVGLTLLFLLATAGAYFKFSG